MRRLLLAAAALLLTSSAADASHRDRRPVRRVLGAVVRPFAPREGGTVVRSRAVVRTAAPVVAAPNCATGNCAVPAGRFR